MCKRWPFSAETALSNTSRQRVSRVLSSAMKFTSLRGTKGSHMEGFWSLLRSWLRPHRGISQEHLPLYLGFFEFVHNAKNRGKGLLDSLGFPWIPFSVCSYVSSLESIKSHLYFACHPAVPASLNIPSVATLLREGLCRKEQNDV